jgi:2-C-methyl-D-erythritol 4-phosphate cytidylyltransferase
MHSSRPKALLPLLGRPLLAWTLEAVVKSNLFAEVLVACPPGEEQAFEDAAGAARGTASVHFIAGGHTRQESVANAIGRITADCDLVAIHDGARPLVTKKILRETLEQAAKTGAAVAAVPSKDTIKFCDERGIIERTLDRNRLRLAQTPQCFRIDILKRAYEKAREAGFSATDDSALVEWSGVDVHLADGSYENIKVTTPDDLFICEEILKRRRPE